MQHQKNNELLYQANNSLQTRKLTPCVSLYIKQHTLILIGMTYLQYQLLFYFKKMLQFCDNVEQGGCGHMKKIHPSIVFIFNEQKPKKPSCVSWLNLIA
jgi:hypothetical protein